MALFGLACEGVTDQAVIENILCGFYKDCDLDAKIERVQPPYDKTDEQKFGGWENLLQYLGEKRFRDDVVNSGYVIIQLDTDISEHPNFGILKNTENIEEYIEKIYARLIVAIDVKESFYSRNQEKIVFAISVHSLECWLLPLCKKLKSDKITACYEALQRECKDINTEKTYRSYVELSKSLSKNKTLMEVTLKNSSLRIFLNRLPKAIKQ